MPTKQDMDAAWKYHDDETHDRACDKLAPLLKDKDGNVMKDEAGNELHDWNDKLGHSKYNKSCRAWVLDYATKNPVPVKTIIVPKPEPLPKKPCAYCHKLTREDRLYEETVTGALVCCRKCEIRIGSKVEATVVEEKYFKEAEKAYVAGERPPEPAISAPVPEPQKPALPGWIIDGVCRKPEDTICDLGFACDGCPYLSPEDRAAIDAEAKAEISEIFVFKCLTCNFKRTATEQEIEERMAGEENDPEPPDPNCPTCGKPMERDIETH